MKNKIIIIGGGGHAGIICDCIREQKKYQIIGYIDKKKSFLSKEKIKYLGPENIFFKNFKKRKNIYFTIAIGDNHKRKKIYNYINKFKINWGTVIHPTASISPMAEISEGAQILNGSIISYKSKISKHVCINTGAIIDHHNYFHSFSSAAPGVCTGGNVEVGESSFLGINCSVKHGIKIGKEVVVGGNAFVNKDCKSNSIYLGIPARKVKKRKSGDSYL